MVSSRCLASPSNAPPDRMGRVCQEGVGQFQPRAESLSRATRLCRLYRRSPLCETVRAELEDMVLLSKVSDGLTLCETECERVVSDSPRSGSMAPWSKGLPAGLTHHGAWSLLTMKQGLTILASFNGPTRSHRRLTHSHMEQGLTTGTSLGQGSLQWHVGRPSRLHPRAQWPHRGTPKGCACLGFRV